MSRAKKPWVHKRANRTGWWVGWYDQHGRRHAKQLPNKALAQQFAARKSLELNGEYRRPGDAVPISWTELLQEYKRSMQIRNLEPASIERSMLSLSTFASTMKIAQPKQVTQRRIEDFILASRKRISRFGRPLSDATINTDIRNLRQFVKWASDPKHPYITEDFDLHETKTESRKARALPDDEFAKLLGLFNDTRMTEHPAAWRIRILLAGATGLRAGDIERLLPEHFDPSDQTVLTRSKKTKKVMVKRPIPTAAWALIWPYVQTRQGQSLFPDTFTSKVWTRIRRAADLPAPLTKKEKAEGKSIVQTFRFHDLRILFTSSLVAQNVPTGVAQKLLEHSTPRLTNEVYTDFDPTLRPAVETLPVSTWLKDVLVKERHKDGSAAQDSATDSNQDSKSARG